MRSELCGLCGSPSVFTTVKIKKERIPVCRNCKHELDAGKNKVCQGCRSQDGAHTFGNECSLTQED